MMDWIQYARDLPLGFRFFPTDEELLAFYLKRKMIFISSKNTNFDDGIIPELDVFMYEPWELPSLYSLYGPPKAVKEGIYNNGQNEAKEEEDEEEEQEENERSIDYCYFFNTLHSRYRNGSSSRSRRSTKAGYWKATGKDRKVLSHTKPVGLKKTLVFYQKKGGKTNWIMHEFHLLSPSPLPVASSQNNSLVICRVHFRKMKKQANNNRRKTINCSLINNNPNSNPVPLPYPSGPIIPSNLLVSPSSTKIDEHTISGLEQCHHFMFDNSAHNLNESYPMTSILTPPSLSSDGIDDTLFDNYPLQQDEEKEPWLSRQGFR